MTLAFWALLVAVFASRHLRLLDLDEDWQERQREVFATCLAGVFLTMPIAYDFWLVTRR